MDSVIVNEDFGLLPFNLYYVDDIYGQKLYSSNGLKDKYLAALAKQQSCKPVIDKIKQLVDSGLIVPCYTSKNLFGLLKHKLMGTSADKAIMGFYEPTKNKVYILFDNRLQYMMWVDNELLSLVTIHELMHYTAKNFKKKFYNIFKQDLINFYREFYLDFANVELHDKQLELMIVGALTIFEWEKDVTSANLIKYKSYLERMFTLLDSEQKIMVVDFPLECATLFWKNPNLFIAKAKSDKDTNRLVFALWRSYDRAFKISNPDTFPIQEIMFPSEVISISSERPNIHHYKAINSIR